MRESKLWKMLALLGACVWLGVKNGIRYGWLAGHAKWVIERPGIHGRIK